MKKIQIFFVDEKKLKTVYIHKNVGENYESNNFSIGLIFYLILVFLKLTLFFS